MDSKQRGIYLALFGAWFFLAVFTALFSITNDFRNAKLRFFEYADGIYGEIYSRLQTNEAVLDSMAAFLAMPGTTNSSDVQISHYALQVRSRYPHIYMIEAIEKVARQDLARFVSQKRAGSLPEFRVQSFSHTVSRAWQPFDNKPWYYPVVFRDPAPAESTDILGLDMDSVPLLRQAISQSASQGHSVASHPFRSAEGNWAYMMFRPVALLRSAAAKTGSERQLFAALVIKAQAILPHARPETPGLRVSLYHSDFPAHQPDGELIHFERRGRSPLETFLFPKLDYQRILASDGQPFMLLAEQQLGWSDLDLHLLAAIFVAGALSFGILLKFTVAHRHSETKRRLTEHRLAYLANHDALTGLANRTLLMDRLAHAMARAHRCNAKLALLFLDLNKFKQVNDRYGHGVGDQLLKMVADRICCSVREDDTVARLSGDEFVVILESITTRQDAEIVTEAIKNNLAQPFTIDDEIALHVGVSIGVAIYPDESKDIDELIKRADHAMYKAKGGVQSPL